MKGKDYFWNRMLFQLVNGGFSDEIHFISKANCQVMNSSKKQTNEFVFTTMPCVFVRFWKKLKTPKRHFEIIWPLNVYFWMAFKSLISLLFYFPIYFPIMDTMCSFSVIWRLWSQHLWIRLVSVGLLSFYKIS